LVFGPQWDIAVPILRWLSITAMVGSLMYQCDNYFTAIGRVDIAARSEVLYQSVGIAITVGAALRGLEMVAAAQVLVYVIAVIIYYQALLSKGSLSFRSILSALAPSALVTLTAGVGPALVYVFYPPVDGRLWLPLLAAGTSAAVGWLLGLYWVRHPIWYEIHLASTRFWQRHGARTA
jgi:O-antigen/teichoic acid export membrane protein